MKLPTTPQGWAIHLSKLVKIFHEVHGLDRFPIKIASIATEYSRNVFPGAPITKVEGLDLSAKFVGMLLRIAMRYRSRPPSSNGSASPASAR